MNPNQTEIKAVFFDLGKVLVDFNWNEVLNKIEPLTPVPADQFNRRILGHPKSIAYETGKISTGDYFSWMKEELTYTGTIDELILAWSDIFTPLSDRINLLPAIKTCYKLGMISNTCDAHIRLLKSRYSFFGLFDSLTLSFEAGVMKPDPEIYNIAAGSLCVSSGESLFIDDLEENITAAGNLGWQTLLVLPDENLASVLRKKLTF